MVEELSPEPEPEKNPFLDAPTTYRQSLIAAEQAMQSEYDKAVMTLSGGALGLSFTFLKDIVGTRDLSVFDALLCAWVSWGLSITLVLASFFTSTKALRRAVADTDLQMIYLTLAKSRWATATKILNALGGFLFFVGLLSLVVFVAYNHPK